CPKGGIIGPIDVEAEQGPVGARRQERFEGIRLLLPTEDDLAVGLDQKGVPIVNGSRVGTVQILVDHSAVAKACVERAIGVEASDREVVELVCEIAQSDPPHDNLAVRSKGE